MFYTLLKIIRKITKSIGKKEEYFIDSLNFHDFKNKFKKNINFPSYDLTKNANQKTKIYATNKTPNYSINNKPYVHPI